MIQVFKTDEEYVKWLDGQRLPSGIVVYVSDNETMYFSTNNIKGELKTYKCEKEEPIQYPPLIYSTNAAGSTITVNGQSMTLEQGDNMVLNYATAITSVKATSNTALTYIQIPNTVTSIGDNAFEGCTALTDFNFNGTMAQWGAITLGTNWKNNAAFTVVHCTDGDVTLEQPIQPIQPNNLVYSTNAAGSTITVNGETVTLGQGENIVLDYPTAITSVKATDNTALTAIQIPNTVTSLESHAFRSCSSLVSINIPNGVTSIGNNAFSNCSSLVSINIPDGVTSIGNSVFMGCSSLVSINIPDGVPSISIGTFYKCSKLTSVNIPDSVTSIGDNAFYECSKLTSFNIPDGVTSIGNGAFYNCSKLTDFNYNGTTAQWSSITKDRGWKNSAAFKVVHCTDGDVAV